MLFFILSNLYAQEPSSEQTDTPPSPQEDETSSVEGDDSTDGAKKDEESSKSEEAENVEPSKEQVEQVDTVAPIVQTDAKNYCVGGVDSSQPNDESSHACNAEKIRTNHQQWTFATFVQDPQGNCYACWEEVDSTCTSVFLMDNPSWSAHSDSCTTQDPSAMNAETSDEGAPTQDASKAENPSKSTEKSLDIDVQDIPKEKAVRENGVVTLKNGDTLHGSILDDENGVHIDVGGNKDLHVPDSSILTLSYPKGQFMQQDLGYTRYFYAPTAMPMTPKTGYLSQKELLFSAVAYSPVQDLSVLVGTSVPFALLSLFYGDLDSILGVVGLRYGTEVYEDVYVGGGIETFFIAEQSLSIPFVNATYGDSEQHITIGGGVTLLDFDIERTELIPLYFSAYKRISPSIAFITENWILNAPYSEYVYTGVMTPGCDPNIDYCYEDELQYDWRRIDVEMVASSIGIRFIAKKFTTDLGLVNTFSSGDYFPVPWLDVSWYFGENVQ
ncbi:MAG: hypothetical protein CL916_06675 [Deltaproteobacteria bacterium]|nr:hypothetical protein [Deltaproteobacteria bacterium]